MRFVCCFFALWVLSAGAVAQALVKRQNTMNLFAARAGETLVLPELKQLSIVGNSTLMPDNTNTNQLIFKQVPRVLDLPKFRLRAGAALGKPVSQESLQRIQQAVRLALQTAGEPFFLVYYPKQDVTDGRVSLVVQGGRVGRIIVRGNRYFPAETYTRHLPLEVGSPLSRDSFSQATAAMSTSSYRKATIELQPGRKPGTSDVLILAQERKPWEVHMGIANTGTATTAKERIMTGFTWGDVLGTDQSLAVNWISDPEAKYSRTLTANYVVPLAKDRLTFLGSYTHTRAKLAYPLKQQGKDWQLGLNYDLALPVLYKRYQQGLQFGLDYKYSDNSLKYVLPPYVIPLSGNPTMIAQARLSYHGAATDAWGQTNGSLTLTGEPGDLGRYNHDADFQRSRAMAKSHYLYGQLNLSRDTGLRGFMKGWNWRLHASWQRSSANLLSSELFVLGGHSSVRGYKEGEVVGDQGWLFSQELVAPGFSLLKGLGVGSQHRRDNLRPFIFEDYGQAWNVDELPGEHRYTMHSLGLGMRYHLARYVSAELSYGWQLRDSGNSQSTDHSALHFSLQLSY